MTDEEIQKLADQIRAPIAYTTESLAEALHVSRNKITMWRHVGVIGAIRSGSGYTSRQYHTQYGIGYTVCQDCYNKEWQQEVANMKKGEKDE